jgi:hypothetical protein
MKSPAVFQWVFGVDFSGARLAGRNTWLARLAVVDPSPGRFELLELSSLEALAGTAARDAALAWLVRSIRASRGALWGIDAPLGLPVALFDEPTSWRDQLAFAGSFEGDALAFGRHLVARSRRTHGATRARRVAEREANTPFDAYHYRIVHQTFHAMRDVARPLAVDERVAVLPFDAWQPCHEVAVVEACPSSTLARLGLPRRGYKQPAGGTITPERRATRERLLTGIEARVHVAGAHRRALLENPGGDAIDAVLAAIGAFDGVVHGAWRDRVASEPRVAREGWVFA